MMVAVGAREANSRYVVSSLTPVTASEALVAQIAHHICQVLNTGSSGTLTREKRPERVQGTNERCVPSSSSYTSVHYVLRRLGVALPL